MSSEPALFSRWSSFMRAHDRVCGCGHKEWHHTGFREPGCSYAGACACRRFTERTPND